MSEHRLEVDPMVVFDHDALLLYLPVRSVLLELSVELLRGELAETNVRHVHCFVVRVGR